MRSDYERRSDRSAVEVATAIAASAEDWGAVWQPDGSGGILTLPVSHGLHHGLLEGPVSIEKDPFTGGSTLRFRVEASQSRVNWTACLLLVFGAIGGVIAMLWPFFPGLLQLAPAGIVLAIAAWLLVASKLRNADADDFFDLVLAEVPENE